MIDRVWRGSTADDAHDLRSVRLGHEWISSGQSEAPNSEPAAGERQPPHPYPAGGPGTTAHPINPLTRTRARGREGRRAGERPVAPAPPPCRSRPLGSALAVMDPRSQCSSTRATSAGVSNLQAPHFGRKVSVSTRGSGLLTCPQRRASLGRCRSQHAPGANVTPRRNRRTGDYRRARRNGACAGERRVLGPLLSLFSGFLILLKPGWG